MNRFALILPLVAGALAACATTAPEGPAPQVHVDGPKFAAADFDCGAEPVPPDPAPAKATGKAGALYDNRLAGWGRGCRDKLASAGRTLDAAGQVAKASEQ